MRDTTQAVRLSYEELSDLIFALLHTQADNPKCFIHDDVHRLYCKLRDARREIEEAPFK